MSFVPGDIGSKAIASDGLQVDHISENTVGHGSRVRGVSDPTSYPILTGDVGEEIIAYASGNTTTTAADTEIDVTGVSITVTAGVWDLSYSASTFIERLSGTVNVAGRVRITDSSNTVEANTEGGCVLVFNGVTGDTYAQIEINKVKRITLTTSKTYKLRVTCSLASASGNMQVFTGNATGSITGNEGTTYIRAVRVS
jgi:hypothetical protein